MYVHMDLRESNYSMRSKEAEETKVTLGPFVRIESLYSESGELRGVDEQGHHTQLMEAKVGQGGYCDTCAYNYVGWEYFDGKKSWDVLGFRVSTEKQERR